MQLILRCSTHKLHAFTVMASSGSSGSSRKRKILDLEHRVAVLKKIDSGQSFRKVVNELGVGKTQIQGIVHNREDIMKRWEAGERTDRKYAKFKKVGYEEINKVMWEWFTRARAKNIPVSGKLIQEQALMYATELGHSTFHQHAQ